ncbi:hypothetical protein [Effusibacillus pohliae]|uniref:hypothetical protein n=1 Tax=Effusibacillus pohliae TaxID=232270 RepID=UPI000374F30A|nr:hypothetical protein [Effusibacillus pohliae]
MLDASYRILKIFDAVGSVHGRKKFQKMVHLLTSSGADFPFTFEYHHFGPYSAELQEEIAFLVQQGLLAESKENEAYVYRITEKGRAFKENLENSGVCRFHLAEAVVASLSEKNPQFLEMVSTYAFLLESGYDVHSAAEKAADLKPHLRAHLEEAVGFYHTVVTQQR